MMEPLRGTADIVDTLLEGCTSPYQLVDRLEAAQRRQQDSDG